MPKDTETSVEPIEIDENVQINKVSTVRRLAPQVNNTVKWILEIISNNFTFFFVQFIVATIKNLIILNKSLFDGFSTIVIPALLGISTNLDPNETIRITPSESSWLCKFQILFREKMLQKKRKLNLFCLQPLAPTLAIHLVACWADLFPTLLDAVRRYYW